MITEHELTLTFKVGTVEELGFGGLKQTWVDADDNGQHLALTAGAGLGSSLLEASVRDGEEYLFAQADIRPVAEQIFRILQSQLATDQHSRLSQELELEENHGQDD